MTGTVTFEFLIPLPLIITLALMITAVTLFAARQRLAGWGYRFTAGGVVIAALTGPSLQQEETAQLEDIVLLLSDRSASQSLSDRAAQTDAALAVMKQRLAARPNTSVREITLSDGVGNAGTQMLSTLSQALAQEPNARIAGVIAVTDGRVHDLDLQPDLPAPLQVLLTGEPKDWDRRLIVENAPAFAILDEPITLSLRVEDQGAGPNTDRAPLQISVDGGAVQTVDIPLNQTFEVPVTLQHGGRNVIEFSVPLAEGELTDRNNAALVQINGVRDRLRVLLVSGEPHPGGRTWRNLLKSDSSVDLVHFTILRPPEKQDGVPVNELSLIAFPTRELFLEKIDDFDLIIFDRYKRRGILPTIYLENVARYVENGGAVLVAAGPDFASAESLYRSPLAQILPASPTARVVDRGYTPRVTDIGARHPVTAGLQPSDEPDWGRWLRQVELDAPQGNIVMSGVDGAPLLVLNRVKDGRIALLASDQAWLWDRGFEGGGPQLELLRRLAHWMMGEPELEEEVLTAEADGQSLRIVRRTLNQSTGQVIVTSPSGQTQTVTLDQTAPGRFSALIEGQEMGLYRLAQSDMDTVIGLGPAAAREFEETIADATSLTPLMDQFNSSAVRLSDGVPRLRDVRPGRPSTGRGWIGLTPRNATETLNVRRVDLLPPWLVLLLALGLILAGWLREARR